MKVAALYDIHGNLPALDAVLAELDALRPDVILVGGDVVAGPFPVETLERLIARANVRFIRGNTEREVVHLGPDLPSNWIDRLTWVHEQFSPEQLGFLERLPESAVLDVDGLGLTLFVHGSPRSDEEIITTLTPDDRLAEILAGVDQKLVVGGHTHMQLDRTVGGVRFVNAGSVGLPYEDRPGAYWALLGPEVEHRRTEYDLARVASALRASGFPRAEEFVSRYLIGHPSPLETARFFESLVAEKASRQGSQA